MREDDGRREGGRCGAFTAMSQACDERRNLEAALLRAKDGTAKAIAANAASRSNQSAIDLLEANRRERKLERAIRDHVENHGCEL